MIKTLKYFCFIILLSFAFMKDNPWILTSEEKPKNDFKFLFSIGGGGGGYYGGGGGAGSHNPSKKESSNPGGQESGGLGGRTSWESDYNGSSGGYGFGGSGGNAESTSQSHMTFGSMGGAAGGLLGENGYLPDAHAGTGGAGGSSYIGELNNGVTNSGIKEGNGLVIISYCMNCDNKKELEKEEKEIKEEAPAEEIKEEAPVEEIKEETPAEEVKEEEKLTIEQLMPGCWSLEFQWDDCKGDWQDGVFCFKSNGIVFEEEEQVTWDLNGNNLSIIYENGTKYTGVYRNGIFTGTIIGYLGDNGCFKMSKK